MNANPDICENFEAAAMKQYANLAEFKEDHNNFWLDFYNGSITQMAYRSAPWFQRYQVSFPQPEAALTAAITELGPIWPDNDELWRQLYEAYRQMSLMVSIHDPYVVTNGVLDPDLLQR